MDNEELNALAERALLHNDAEAWVTLIEQVRPDLIVAANRVVRDANIAADAVQDALRKICERREEYRGDTFLAWAMKITRNASIDIIKRRETRRKHEGRTNTDVSLVPDPDDDLQGRIAEEEIWVRRRVRLRFCLQLLTEKQREVIWLRFLELPEGVASGQSGKPRTLQIIAEKLNISRPAVQTRLNRAEMILRKCLDSDTT